MPTCTCVAGTGSYEEFGYLVTAFLSPWYIPFLTIVNLGTVWSHIRSRQYHDLLGSMFKRIGCIIICFFLQGWCMFVCLVRRCSPLVAQRLFLAQAESFLCRPPPATTPDSVIITMSASTTLSTVAVSQVTGKVVTKALLDWKNKLLTDLHIIYSICTDVKDLAQTELTKLGAVDPATLVAVTQSALTRMLTDFATTIDPSLPQCMQTLFLSAIPLVVKEVVVVETSALNELQSAGLCCFSTSSATAPASTTTTAVTPNSALTYIASCDAPAVVTTSSPAVSMPSSPVATTTTLAVTAASPSVYIR